MSDPFEKLLSCGDEETTEIPFTPLGFNGTELRLRTAVGVERHLAVKDLLNRAVLVDLCGGEAWLRQTHPGALFVVAERAGGGRRVAIGIDIPAAARDIALRCAEAERARTAAGWRAWCPAWLGGRRAGQ